MHLLLKPIIFALIPLILSIGITPAFAAQHDIMSPYHQIKNGVLAEDVICKSGLALMIRQHGVPACVKGDSVQKLAETYAWGFVAPKMEKKDDVEITTDINKITELNWLDPENRNLGFRNMEKFVQFPHEVSNGLGPVHEFGSDLHDLSDIKVEYFDEVMPFEEWLEKSHTDAILVLHENDIVYEKYLRMDPNERHSIQSISKTIVPALLGNYLQDGSMDVDKQMKEYIPDIGSGYAEATFQQVLDMDVSNDYDGNFDDLNSDAYKYETGAGWKPDVENKWPGGHRDFIKSITSDDVTGSGVSQYQDPNTDSSAWVIDEITGKKYYDLFEQDIYSHLGAEQDAMINLDNQDNAFAAGGWQMTLRDLARYSTIWMNDGIAPDGERVIPAEWIDELRDPTKGVPYKGYEELNIQYHNQMTSDGTFLAHAGWGGQFMYADPDNKVSYVMFSSLTDPRGQTIEDLTTMYEFGLILSEYFSETEESSGKSIDVELEESVGLEGN